MINLGKQFTGKADLTGEGGDHSSIGLKSAMIIFAENANGCDNPGVKKQIGITSTPTPGQV
ncbi:MAG: hypothetical protein OEY94_00310 [Alphaproteobacteria bacterium]|nr:hypothetical protein [Alphaproteobacteria bacterium]